MTNEEKAKIICDCTIAMIAINIVKVHIAMILLAMHTTM